MTRTLLFLLTLVVYINISAQARRQHHNGDCCNTSANRCCGVGWGLHCCDARGVICCQDEELVALPPRDGPDYKPSPVLTKKHDYFDWDFDWEFDGEWVAISICIIAAVLIFSAAVFCCCRKKRKSNTRLLSDHRLLSGYNYGTLYNTPQGEGPDSSAVEQ
ncbi:unnamed protein product [Timema podura]|uniref:Uncharacterized protein n=1 Tax=Timema podura TaxID=61482 RepID=A0ABN7PI73_TIMPD|nr:unnamed protein product [Timema podura]